MKTLNELGVGETSKIVHLNGEGAVKRRMMDMGLTKGTEVTLSATPASNYSFDYWEVVSGDVTVESNKFTIGDSAVTVKAHFKATV